jgi:alanine racemase
MNSSTNTTWLEIDLGAIRNNIRKMQEITKGPIMAVVKANAYGHGMAEVMRAAKQVGINWFGLARFEEAVAACEVCQDDNIIALGYTPPAGVAEAIQKKIILTVFDRDTAEAYSSQARPTGQILQVHVKFDTGMGRLGHLLGDGVEFVRWLKSLPGLDVKGIFTHFARADEPGQDETSLQIQRFNALLDALQSAGLRPPLVHASNSAGSIYFPAGRYDMVRSGIAIYGLSPSGEARLPEGFKPAMSLKSILTSIKELPAGHGISYNHRYRTSRTERVGVVGTGYADGFRRRLGNYALVHGKRVPVLGIVCMDQCMLQLEELPQAKVGDEVVLMGQQGGQAIRAEDLAREWQTSCYEVVCGMSARPPRIYIEG